MSESKQHIPQIYLKIDGADVPVTLMRDLLEVTVESSLHMPDAATIVIQDKELTWVDSALLDAGKALVISAQSGDGASQDQLFDGEIVEIEPEFESAGLRLVIRAYDRLHRLSRGRHYRSFQNVNDSDIASTLISEAGLTASSAATPEVMEHVFQDNVTNLEFLRERALARGFLLYAEGRTIHFKAPASSGSPIILKWGETLAEFRPRLSTMGQVNSVSVRGWDSKQKQAIVGQATAPTGDSHAKNGITGSGGSKAQSAFSIQAAYLVDSYAPINQGHAEKIAQAYKNQFESRFIEAEGTCGGDPKIVAGIKVKIENVGRRFSGTYFVTSASHRYNAQEGFVTSFSASGLHPSTLLSLLQPEASAGGGLTVLIGIVTDNNDAEAKLGRVKVKFPTLSEDHASFWLRVVSPGAGAQRGLQIIPEVNDEVLVVFMNGDVNSGYVLGGLWNGKDAPPYPPAQAVKSGKVIVRSLKARTGAEITITEDAGSKEEILIKSTAGMLVRISDTDKLIELKSQKSTVKLDDQGNAVSVDTSGDLKLTSKGKVSIEGTQGIDVKSSTTLSLSGNSSVEVKSSASLSLSGTASTELKSSGVLTVQGSLVKIN